jgi:hypothetical protein
MIMARISALVVKDTMKKTNAPAIVMTGALLRAVLLVYLSTRISGVTELRRHSETCHSCSDTNHPGATRT